MIRQSQADEVAGQQKTDDLATPIWQELVEANRSLRDVVDSVGFVALQKDGLLLGIVGVLGKSLKQCQFGRVQCRADTDPAHFASGADRFGPGLRTGCHDVRRFSRFL